MANEVISRRDILRTLAVGSRGRVGAAVIPAEAAEYVHRCAQGESCGPGREVRTQIFSAPQYATLLFCATPSSPRMKSPVAPSKRRAGIHRSAHQRESGISIEARRRTLLARRRLHGSYGNVFMECTPEQKTES